MISDRNFRSDTAKSTPADFGVHRGDLTYWINESPTAVDPAKWRQIKDDDFRDRLVQKAAKFRANGPDSNHEDQKHVTLYVHGFGNNWKDEVTRYDTLCKRLFSGNDSLGECVLFDWPSYGEVYDYFPDRANAQNCAADLADALSELYDWMLGRQALAVRDPAKACRAKTSIIAHSMGNFVLQKAMATVWSRKNQPLLVSLVNQLLMVAADVDNNLFGGGETITKSDGDAVANLTYRITALYSGKDPVLGMSAGLKHFGKRRLGRSGIDRNFPVSDNVWDIDCSQFFHPSTVSIYPMGIHGAYFEVSQTIDLMKDLLRGVDRTVLLGKKDVIPQPLPRGQQRH